MSPPVAARLPCVPLDLDWHECWGSGLLRIPRLLRGRIAEDSTTAGVQDCWGYHDCWGSGLLKIARLLGFRIAENTTTAGVQDCWRYHDCWGSGLLRIPRLLGCRISEDTTTAGMQDCWRYRDCWSGGDVFYYHFIHVLRMLVNYCFGNASFVWDISITVFSTDCSNMWKLSNPSI